MTNVRVTHVNMPESASTSLVDLRAFVLPDSVEEFANQVTVDQKWIILDCSMHQLIIDI